MFISTYSTTYRLTFNIQRNITIQNGKIHLHKDINILNRNLFTLTIKMSHFKDLINQNKDTEQFYTINIVCISKIYKYCKLFFQDLKISENLNYNNFKLFHV